MKKFVFSLAVGITSVLRLNATFFSADSSRKDGRHGSVLVFPPVMRVRQAVCNVPDEARLSLRETLVSTLKSQAVTERLHEDDSRWSPPRPWSELWRSQRSSSPSEVQSILSPGPWGTRLCSLLHTPNYYNYLFKHINK